MSFRLPSFAIAALIGAAALVTSAAAFAQAPADAPAEAESEPPQTFGHWALRCGTPQGGERTCTLNQVFAHNETKRQVLRLTLIHKKPENTNALLIVAPLGSDLSRNPTFAVPGLPAAAPPYRFCVRDGCYAELLLSAQFLAEMQKGGQGQVSFRPFGGENAASLPVSFQGFAEGFAAFLAAQ
ncbi:MAG TPA: invasion associated locus B family protein [Sphingomonadales bacterium]|nr:invasion associated locus B family protein [Sphingomonadales bacterium]